MNDYENMNENEKLRLLAEVAHLYYDHNMTQSEISERLFISRPKISRLLKEAREKEIVQIIIKEPWERLTELEAEFLKRFNLKDIRILNVKNTDYQYILNKLGELGAYYINGIITKDLIVGMSWGNTIYQTIQSIKSSKNIPITVVQIMGAALRNKPELDSIDLAKQFAKAYGGKYHYLYAPLFVKDKSIKEELIKDPYISDTICLAKKADVILTSVGSMEPTISSPEWHGYIDSYNQYQLQSNGAVGHIGGHFYDIEGQKVSAELDDRLIGIDIKDFIKTPNVICVAGGIDKAKSILGALKGSFINTLITDSTAALKILELTK
ncbi:sugar-binding transcriptional regulator [Haloimpatiens sp. FM7315]|uniref:sugar-binding transcriptional regulator n=1 Tax=Haloimpatiens sp. FM7315 TaxID=3298609 RepID=UPI0035A2EBEE